MREKLLSIKEAAKRLGVNERTVRRWIEAGQIRAVKKQGRGGRKGVYFIPEAELESQKRS